jgi:hypothetical protein
MKQFNFDLSNALAGNALLETSKQFSEAKSGFYGLESVEVHNKSNEETGESSKSLRVNFRSVSDERIVKSDYFRSRQADTLIKGLKRFRYLAIHAGKEELLNDIPFPITIIGSYSSKEDNKGVLLNAKEQYGNSVSNVFAEDLYSSISNNEIIKAIKEQAGEDDIFICSVDNADSYINKIESIAKELIGAEYHVTIGEPDKDGYTNITKYKMA